MIKKILTTIVIVALSVAYATAKEKTVANDEKYVAATPCFNIQIFEAGDSMLTFNDPQHIRKTNATNANRGFLSGLFKSMRQSYQTTLTGQIATTSGDILSSGIGLIAELFRSKRSDWYTQVKKECQFVKKISMGQEIHDFYGSTTTQGALDPDGMLFNGFGCTQYYIVGRDTIPALYLRCNLRRDEQGLNRILNHGKFEVEVAQLYINPYICGLPNDSLMSDDVSLRIPFDFKKRKNLKLQIVANVSSSWMTQAIQIYNDQHLGQFIISLTLPDSTSLETEGNFKDWYVYDTNLPTATAAEQKPQIVGESFIVPRSYIGTADGDTFADVWGTGQYKIDLTLSASCDINEDYYLEQDDAEVATPRDPSQGNAHPAMPGQKKNKHWNRYWSEEWNMMKKRNKTNKSFFNAIADNITVNYKDGRWVYTILEPIANYILSEESVKVNKAANSLFGLDASDATSTSTMSSASTTSTPSTSNAQSSSSSTKKEKTNGGEMPPKP